MGGHVTVGVVEDAPDGISLVLLFSSPGKRIGCWRVKGLKFMMIFIRYFARKVYNNFLRNDLIAFYEIPLKNCVSFS